VDRSVPTPATVERGDKEAIRLAGGDFAGTLPLRRLGWRRRGRRAGNRCAAVYRLGSFVSRSRLCLPSAVDGEARVSRGSDAPLRLAFGGGVFEAKATATHRNKVSRPLPRPDDILIRRQRRGRGVMYRSPGPASRHLFQVMLLLPLFFPFLHRCEGGCGCCGWRLAGSGSISPRRRRSSMACLDPGAGRAGAWPRSMGDRRRLHPVFKDECLLRLLSKPTDDGAPPAHGGARCLLRRWRPATTTPSMDGALWI
jgi:hypothetical protein